MILNATKQISFHVPSDLDQLSLATEKLFNFFNELDLGDSDRFDIRLCFEEMLINAMKHGNGLKSDVLVDVEAAYNSDEVFIGIKDKGLGFKVKEVRNPTECENLERNGGRGVFLVQHLMDELQYLDNGTKVEMRKKVKKQS